MDDFLVKASVLSGVRATIEELGGDADASFKRTGLSDVDLNPELWISYRSFLLLLEDASQATNCPHFGLQLSRHQDISIFGALGFVMKQARDLRAAVTEMSTYFMHHSQGGNVSLTVEDGVAQWRFTCKLEGKAPTRQQDDLAAGNAFNLMRLLWRPDWTPTAIYLSHAPTADIKPYKAYFDCPVIFNWDAPVIAFDAAILDCPISDANVQLHSVLEDYLSNLSLTFTEDYCGQIRYLIKQAMSTGDCSIERVANFLAVNKRTLQRQLKDYDTSYKDLLEEVRFDLAQRYLRESNGSLATLADMLCYSGLSALSTAFRRRFGVSPREWKQQQAHNGSAVT